MKTALALAALLAATPALAAPAAQRLPNIAPERMTAEQKKAMDDYRAARGVPLTQGPFMPMLYSPEAMTATRAAGDYFRYKASIGPKLTEFVALLVAREWSADYEWSAHAGEAEKFDISPVMIADMKVGRRPEGMSAAQTICWDFVSELFRNKQVSDKTFEQARARFGEQGVVDITGIVGYYTLLAMQLNVAKTPPQAATGGLPRLP
jgi:4-carboxymuconolactone decarboxylase